MRRKLRFFCDYMADSPLWESWEGNEDKDYWEEGEYNKSKETLKSFGVSDYTLSLMSTLQDIFEWAPSDEFFTGLELAAFEGLQELILHRLEEEIGDKFEIEVV